ncbi:MAG: MarR family transcriptional regulator [Eubacteriales bacterium]|nr:MarR family transcriptional regulator [Eubacteriales bacterium]
MEHLKTVFWEMGCLQRCFLEVVRLEAGDVLLQPSQGPIIGELMCHHGMSQADLVRHMNVSAATVAVSVSRLEKMGMLQREKDERNRHRNVLILTEQGQAAGKSMHQALIKAQEIALNGFNEKELAVMEQFCQRMLSNLQEEAKNRKEGTQTTC